MPAAQPLMQRCTDTIFGSMISMCSQPGGSLWPASINLDALPDANSNGVPVTGAFEYQSYYIASNVTGLNLTIPSTSPSTLD